MTTFHDGYKLGLRDAAKVARRYERLLASMDMSSRQADHCASFDIENKILSLVPPRETGDGWRTMESAPKDGSWVLIWTEPSRLLIGTDGGPTIAAYDAVLKPHDWIDEHGERVRERPTHFRPLPPPPSNSDKGKG